jgi:hypothetical protein
MPRGAEERGHLFPWMSTSRTWRAAAHGQQSNLVRRTRFVAAGAPKSPSRSPLQLPTTAPPLPRFPVMSASGRVRGTSASVFFLVAVMPIAFDLLAHFRHQLLQLACVVCCVLCLCNCGFSCFPRRAAGSISFSTGPFSSTEAASRRRSTSSGLLPLTGRPCARSMAFSSTTSKI